MGQIFFILRRVMPLATMTRCLVADVTNMPLVAVSQLYNNVSLGELANIPTKEILRSIVNQY